MKRVLLIALALGLASCGGGGTSAVELTAADSGRAVTVEAGQALVVTLESNASTGYRWNLVVEPDAAVLGLVASEYVGADTDLVGAPGLEIWRFEALAAGTTSLTLRYFRPFEPENAGGELELSITVE